MPTLYLETSIISYLTSRPSGQIVSRARQILTHRWWDEERGYYDLVTSQYVLDEARRGDPVLASMRLESLARIPLLDIPDAIPSLADLLLFQSALPEKARLDTLHICTAAYHEVDYLLTWNCTHIANARFIPKMRQILDSMGLAIPTICTPEEMVDAREED